MSKSFGHSDKGTVYGESGIAAYAARGYGPDKICVAERVMPFLQENVGDDTAVLDIGCGAGPWSFVCAQLGAMVVAFDSQAGMIAAAEQARSSVRCKPGSVSFSVRDAAGSELPEGRYDVALQILVGCNLPTASFAKSYREMSRLLRPDGVGIVVFPLNIGTVFTDGRKPVSEYTAPLKAALRALGSVDDPAVVAAAVKQATAGILRGTIRRSSDGTWQLVNDADSRFCITERELLPGEHILRILPAGVFPNVYWSSENYRQALVSADLHPEFRNGFCFSDRGALAAHNDTAGNDVLGPEYIGRSWCGVYYLSKRRRI